MPAPSGWLARRKRVEARSGGGEDEGMQYQWWTGTVLRLKKQADGDLAAEVEFDELIVHDGVKEVELLSQMHIRPPPPPRDRALSASEWADTLLPGQGVDAFHEDAWWPAIFRGVADAEVAAAEPAAASSSSPPVVAPRLYRLCWPQPNWPDVTLPASALRPLWEFDPARAVWTKGGWFDLGEGA